MRFRLCRTSHAYVLGLTCLVLIGCGEQGKPSAPPTTAVSPKPAASSPVAMPTEAQCDQAAADFVLKLKSGDPNALGQFLDIDALLERVMADVEVDPQFREGFLHGAKKSGLSSLGQQIAQAVAGGGNYVFLRTHVKDGNRRTLFRLTLPGGGVNYHDMVLERRPNGQIMAVDMYVLLTAEMISTTMRRSYLAAAAGQNRGLVERLTQGESEFVRNLPLFLEITQANQTGQFQKVLAAYDKLPDTMKRDKNFLLLRLTAASRLEYDAVYQATIDDFLKHHPNDPCIDMVAIDGYILKKQYDKALAAIDRVDAFIGSDAYWDVMRGSIHTMAGRFPEAHERLASAEQREPDSADLQWQFVALSLQEKAFAETARRLTKLRDEFGFEFEDLTKLPDYAGFVKSPEYRAWLASASAK